MISWFKALEYVSNNIPPGTPSIIVDNVKFLEVNDGNTGDNDGWFGRQSCIVRSDGVVVRTCREGARHDQETYGIVHISFSDDYGETWSALDTYIDGTNISGFPMRPNGAGAPSGNQRGPSHGLLTLCPNGDLLCQMWSSNYSSDNDGPHQSRSTDGGLTWSSVARITIGSLPGGINSDRVFFGEGYTIDENGVIYACIRNYAVSSPQTEQTGVATSGDNGVTWTFKSWTTTTSNPSPRGTQEQSIEYVGNGRFVSLLREAANQDGWFSYSTDYCATWSDIVDVTSAMGIGSTSWLGRTIMMTRAHLMRKLNWWNDRMLIVTGFHGGTDDQSTGARRNAAWMGIIPQDYDLSNITWYGPFNLENVGYDGGYGCPFYNPLTKQFVQLTYRSPTSLYDASTKQINFRFIWSDAPALTVYNPNALELEGQSNAFGSAPIAELQSDLVGEVDYAFMYGPSNGRWEKFHAGVNNNHGSYFGIEYRLMKLLHEYRGKSQYLYKYALGGTSLATKTGSNNDWNPANAELYPASNTNLSDGQLRLGDSRPPAALIWIQGEDDAINGTAGSYETNLTAFIAAKRSQYGYSIPFIIVRMGDMQTGVSNLTNRNTIRTAQQNVAANVDDCYLVDADGATCSPDNVHYNGAGVDTIAQRVYTCIITNNL